jgi:LPS sulfotransferase NodH
VAEVFPFVIGCARSGTTMLRAMLDSHPLVAVPHESYFAVPAVRDRSSYEVSGVVDRGRLLDDLRRDPTLTRWALPEAVIAALRDDESLQTVPDVIAALYLAYAQDAGKPRFADKTPRNVLHVQLLAESFPQARFVHLVRDGRNVVPSLVGLPYFPDRYAEAVVYWRDRVSQGRRSGRALGPGRYHEVRYEELVADPAPTLRRLCEFLDLAYDEAMLGYHERADEVVVAVAELGHHQGIWQPPTPGMRSWRATMSAHDQDLFEVLAGSTLDQFGYERSGRDPSWSARLEGLAWRSRFQLRSRARRARTRARGGWGSVSR